MHKNAAHTTQDGDNPSK